MVRKRVGCKGFRLNWDFISQEYIGGKSLKDLANEYDVSQFTLLDNFKKLDVRKHVRRQLNKRSFSEFTSGSCYWAGFLAADGWINGKYCLGCELSLRDVEHLRKLKCFLASTAEITYRSRKKFGKVIHSAAVQINSIKIVEDLKQNFNITANKSLTYEVPRYIPDHLVRHFIRGYIDGDGSIGWHKHNDKPRVSIGCGSIKLIEWIKDVLASNILDIGNPKINVDEEGDRKNPLYSIEYTGYQFRNILNWVYKDSDEGTRLERKYNLYLKHLAKLKNYENSLLKKQEEKEKFIRELEFLYKNGMSSKDIANHLNIGQWKILYYLRKSTIDKKEANNQNLAGLKRKERDIQMLHHYQFGCKPKEIALENNLALSSFWVAIRRAKSYVEG